MKKVIESHKQSPSKCKNFCQIIRESVEFALEDLSDSDEEPTEGEIIQNSEEEDYESLKENVLKILTRLGDKKTYKKQYKICKKIADKAQDDHIIGSGY